MLLSFKYSWSGVNPKYAPNQILLKVVNFHRKQVTFTIAALHAFPKLETNNGTSRGTNQTYSETQTEFGWKCNFFPLRGLVVSAGMIYARKQGT